MTIEFAAAQVRRIARALHESTLRRPRVAITLVMASVIAACGSGGDDAPANPVGSGELKAWALVGTTSAAQIARALTDAKLSDAGVAPVYGVASYRLEYLTSDARGAPILASGLVNVPIKAPGARSPVLGYQHGTIFRNAEAPSNNAVASEVSVVLASLGFIVVAPDYVGYGASLGSPHPYLLAGPTAAAVVDFLTATGTWRRGNAVADNGQLFLTGYSEGAYATMAAHRALQAIGSPHLQQLHGEIAGGGPYDVQATLDGLLDLVRDEEPVLGALLDPGFLRHLGSTVRNELRRALLRRLLPDDADVSFDTTFIDNYLADDAQAVAQLSSVHDWKPELPVLLFHGRDDRTVPYASASSALQAMRARGAGGMVGLSDCPATPSSHLGCVGPFITYLLAQLAPQARDL
ncbi:MAG: hypothetical protein KJZ83_16795 [Burkholderiaceae bacterium]|nr:hypothetical protein [Burkholderiaceae bacterium]